MSWSYLQRLALYAQGDLPSSPAPDAPEPELDSKDPMQDIMENKNLIFQVALIGGALKLAKMPDGMKTLQVLGKETISGLFNTLDSLGQASAANHIAGWANPILISGVLERFGMLPPAFNNGFHAGITLISGVDLATSILKDIFGGGGAFPSSLVFAKK